jgi:hypothetical protein
MPSFVLSCLVILVAACAVREEQSPVVNVQPRPIAPAGADSLSRPRPVHDYPFDTVLSGGYSLAPRNELDSEDGGWLDNLYLRRGDELVCLLSSNSAGMPSKNLGYFINDADASFVLVQSFGAGNPHFVSIIDKRTCATLDSGVYLDNDEREGLLLYCRDYDAEDLDTLLLFDARPGRSKPLAVGRKALALYDEVTFPLYNIVTIDTVIGNSIRLAFGSESRAVTQTFPR